MSKKRLSQLSRSIEGKVALVTGSASGMGRATANLFSDEGAKVAIIDRNASGVEESVKEITDAGGIAKGWVLDLTNADEIPRVIEEIVAEFGGLDILINNAGIGASARIQSSRFEAVWDKCFAVNLTALHRTIRAALPHLQKSGEGRIVNIASTEAFGGSAFASPYAAAKHGVVGLTRALAVELGTQGVTVNCICPGAIHTGLTKVISDKHKDKFAHRRVPVKRYGLAEEIAHGVFTFVVPGASYINGATLMVDGGFSIQNNGSSVMPE
ncbi:MAG: SDR family oxidoreductase [Pseudomonadales bacterium]|nr:SDR family oxidoreductase [Pseudomonadales bacterium]